MHRSLISEQNILINFFDSTTEILTQSGLKISVDTTSRPSIDTWSCNTKGLSSDVFVSSMLACNITPGIELIFHWQWQVIDYQKITGFSSLPSCKRLRSGVQLFTTEIYIFPTLVRIVEGFHTTITYFDTSHFI